MFCHKCWKNIPDGSKFCPYCGASQTSDPYTYEAVKGPDAPKNSSSSTSEATTYGIIALILGFLSSGILGIVFGVIGLTKAKTSNEKLINWAGILAPLITWLISWISIIPIFFVKH